MPTGKLANENLEKLLETISFHRKEVLIGAGVGLDTSQIDFGEKICVLSTDPITGAKENIGSLAIDISANDIATSGGEIVGVLLTILAPQGSSIEDIHEIMTDATTRAADLKIEIVGGHTEITNAVNRFVLSTTAVGVLDRSDFIPTNEAVQGDCVYITKHVGIEGTAILAHDKESELLEFLDRDLIEEAKSLIKEVSVIKDAKLAKTKGLVYMHDVTEGGLLGAIYEAHQGIGKGIEIEEEKVPFLPVTHDICKHFKINPLRLISSGSMLIISSDENLEKSFKDSNINITKIGTVTGDKPILIQKDGSKEIQPPYMDELYKVI